MKRLTRMAALLSLLALLLLTACGGQGSASVYDVEYGGETYTVDEENQTIAHDGAEIQMELTKGSGSGYEMTFTYPDGSTYWWRWSDSGMGSGGWSDDYDPERYVDGWILQSVLEQSRPGSLSSSRGANLLPGLLLILFGAAGAAVPRAVWYLSSGWRYKDAEPSDLALLVHRFGGGVMLVLGLLLLFV